MKEVVDALVVGDAMRDRNKGDGGQRVLETLEGRGGWVGGGVEQGSDVGWELVVRRLRVESDSICGIVGSFGHGEDEVGDSCSTRSVEAEAAVGNTTLCDVEGMGRDWGAEMKELCDEGGLEVIYCIDERSFPTFPVES